MTDPGLAGASTDAAEADQRARLNAARLAALARRHFDAEGDHASIGTGAALVHGGVAHVFLDGDFGLGAALAWADRQSAASLRVFVETDAGPLARQAGLVGFPVEVFTTAGTEIERAEASAVSTAPDGPPDAPELLGLLHARGVEVVVEGDRHAAEVNGLEVARIVRAVDDGEPLLEVGVGRFDRHLTALMHGDLTPSEALDRVVEQVRLLRRPNGAILHPIADLVPERWLRRVVLDDPSLIGCDELHAAQSPVVRDRLRERGVASMTGTRSGEPVVAVCTVGIDLDAVVDAADARSWLDPDAALLLVLPARDVLGVTQRLVDRIPAAEIVTVPDDWRR